MEQITFEL